MTTLAAYRAELRAGGYAPATVKVKLQTVEQVARHAGVEPTQLRREHVVAYLDRDLSAGSRRKYLQHLRHYSEWAGLGDVTEGLRMPRQPKAVPRPVSEDQLAQLLAVATRRTRAFLLLGAFAGLRSCEIARVAGRDVEPGPVLRVLGKGGRTDTVPVPQLLARELRLWAPADGGRLWPGLTPQSVRASIKHAADAAGIDMTCHQLRHRYGTALYAESHDLLVVQRLMRHSSPQTTMGYALVADDVGASLVERLPLPA